MRYLYAFRELKEWRFGFMMDTLSVPYLLKHLYLDRTTNPKQINKGNHILIMRRERVGSQAFYVKIAYSRTFPGIFKSGILRRYVRLSHGASMNFTWIQNHVHTAPICMSMFADTLCTNFANDIGLLRTLHIFTSPCCILSVCVAWLGCLMYRLCVVSWTWGSYADVLSSVTVLLIFGYVVEKCICPIYRTISLTDLQR